MMYNMEELPICLNLNCKYLKSVTLESLWETFLLFPLLFFLILGHYLSFKVIYYHLKSDAITKFTQVLLGYI